MGIQLPTLSIEQLAIPDNKSEKISNSLGNQKS